MVRTAVYGYIDQENDILEKIMDIPELNLIGLYNPVDIMGSTNSKIQIKKYLEPELLLKEVDAVIALSPLSGLNNVEQLVKKSKHVFFEPCAEIYDKRITKLSEIIDEANVKVQAGFHHRFNNTILAAKPFIKNPRFINASNFIKYSAENERYSVLSDMLINDIDIILSIVKSSVKNIRANATTIDYKNPDILNVRIEFMNGCVANLTAGKMEVENKHQINFYCQKDYTSIDLINNKASQVKKKSVQPDLNLFQEEINGLIIEHIPVKQNNNLFDEFSSFARSIVLDKCPEVDFETVIKTYEIAEKIKEKIKILFI